MAAPRWSGRTVEKARAYMRATTQWPTPCGLCGKPVHPDPPKGWVVGHIKSRGAHPELTLVKSNWRIEHRKCSDATGQQGVIEKAKAEVRRSGFSPEPPASESPPLPVSPSSANQDPFSIPDALSWPTFTKAAPEWLQPYLVLGETDNPPLAVSPVHPAATGTYADIAIPWIERAEGKRLRWWQKFGLAMKLQHGANGALLIRTIVETAPRRAGKSVGFRGLAMWRQEHGAALFGERQEIIHTGSDLAVCRKLQKEAWPWARAQWGPKSVTMGNGKEAIERPGGDVWLVRAQTAVYGWDTTLGLVDEGWDVAPEVVDEGLGPSLMGRQSPQLAMTSTAHRRATSTMRTAIADALAMEDLATLLLWWGALPTDDPGDPETWRKASPYWDEERAEFVASMYRKALRGEQDPELDDPDPMRGFQSQYCNVWRLKERRTIGEPVISPDAWEALTVARPDGPPDSVAVEAWFGDGVAVVEAWKPAGGPVVVSVSDHPNLTVAAAQIAACGLRRPVLVGASLADHPAWRANGLRVKSMTGATSVAVGDLMRDLAEHRFAHDGSELLTEQVLNLRTTAAPSGPRIRSTGRLDAVKALVWAVDEAAGVRRTMTMPSRFVSTS